MAAGGVVAVAAGTWLAAPSLHYSVGVAPPALRADGLAARGQPPAVAPPPVAFTVRTNAGTGEFAREGRILWQVVVEWEPQPFVNYLVERRDLVITQWSLVQRVESAGAVNYPVAIGYFVLVSDPGEWRVREE